MGFANVLRFLLAPFTDSHVEQSQSRYSMSAETPTQVKWYQSEHLSHCTMSLLSRFTHTLQWWSVVVSATFSCSSLPRRDMLEFRSNSFMRVNEVFIMLIFNQLDKNISEFLIVTYIGSIKTSFSEFIQTSFFTVATAIVPFCFSPKFTSFLLTVLLSSKLLLSCVYSIN